MTEENKEDFLNPLYEKLYDPYFLKGMEQAVVRIFEAIEGKEKIIIYSDLRIKNRRQYAAECEWSNS